MPSAWCKVETTVFDANTAWQIAISVTEGRVWTRSKTVGNWLSWNEVALNTETIATAGTIFTPESGISIVSASYNQYKLGKTVSLCFSVKKTDGSAFSGTRVSLGTLATGWRPAVQNNILIPGNKTSGSYMSTIGGTLLIYTNGNISVDIVSNDAKEIQINCTYLQKY